MPIIDIVQLIVNQRQMKQEIATSEQRLCMCLFAQVTETFNGWPSDFEAV